VAEAERPRFRAVPWKTSTAERVEGALGEIPAYVKRALRVERAVDALFRAAERRYREGLRFVALRRRERDAAAGARASERAERVLAGTVDRFNARWAHWLKKDGRYAAVNAEIEGYNRWYAVERQCAVKYVPLDSIRQEKRAPLGPDDLLARFPLLGPDGRPRR